MRNLFLVLTLVLVGCDRTTPALTLDEIDRVQETCAALGLISWITFDSGSPVWITCKHLKAPQ